MAQCPCGSSQDYDACCGPIIGGDAAPTAEALMRSRYTAFSQGNVGHLVATMAPESSADFDALEAESTAAQSEWQGLDVRGVVDGGSDDDTGTVEFVARFTLKGEPRVHHELTACRREKGRWVCVGGEVNPKQPPRTVDKVGRNDPCPCGSGKKFKKCCGK